MLCDFLKSFQEVNNSSIVIINACMTKVINYLIYVFWDPYFKTRLWIFLLPLLVLAYSGFSLMIFAVSEKDLLEVVEGTYRPPLLGNSKTDSYNTVVQGLDGQLERCNCDPGGRVGGNCLSENKSENRKIVQQLRGKPVEVLMTRKKWYEYNRICYEIRSEGHVLVSYERLREKYLLHKRLGNFDEVIFVFTLAGFILLTFYRSFLFLRNEGGS